MRIPGENENLVGKVCVCSIGRLGIVTGKTTIKVRGAENLYDLEGWAGIGFDGKGNWFSANPVVTAETGHEMYKRFRDRFNGRTSYN